MRLSPIAYMLWGTSTLLTLLVCAYAYYRGLLARLPFFTSYLTLFLVRSLLLWSLYLIVGYDSRLAFHYYWWSQSVLVLARGAIIVELAWRALREYRGVWGLSWILLCVIALVLLGVAAWDANAQAAPHWLSSFILSLERGLEFAAAGVLLTLLLLSRYYVIGLEPVQRSIALGLAFYSAFQVLNNTILQRWLPQYFALWNDLRMVSSGVMLVIWLAALLKPLPEASPAPVLLSQQVYDQVSPQVNYRLRALNQRLLEMLGT